MLVSFSNFIFIFVSSSELRKFSSSVMSFSSNLIDTNLSGSEMKYAVAGAAIKCDHVLRKDFCGYKNKNK